MRPRPITAARTRCWVICSPSQNQAAEEMGEQRDAKSRSKTREHFDTPLALPILASPKRAALHVEGVAQAVADAVAGENSQADRQARCQPEPGFRRHERRVARLV